MKYLLDVGDAGKLELDVPDGADAVRMFLDAAEQKMGIGNRQYLALSKVHREYAGAGGLFETYQMARDSSGHVFGTVWIEASQL